MLKYNYLLNLSKKDIEKFWSKVPKDLNNDICWEWLGIIDFHKGEFRARFGFSPFLNRRIRVSAARIMYFLIYGEFNINLNILHSCDNGKCINHNHLFLGTQLDNMIDRMKKGKYNTQRNRKIS